MKKEWSIDLEHGEYENNIELVVEHAIQAVDETEVGGFVNLVTPNGLGNPEDYLSESLKDVFGDRIKMRFIDQCGCGGFVLRVWKV